MSVTALLWITLYCLAIAGSVLNPIFGALGYLLEYYMRPELKWWGDDLPALRYNLIVSLVLGATFLLRRNGLRDMAKAPNLPLRWLLALAGVMAAVTVTVAVSFETSVDWVGQWLKMAIIFPMLVVGVVRTPNAFNLFVAGHMLGAFWWGWEAWMDPERAQGRLLNIGSGDTLNDNAASAHLLTVLPFTLVYLLTEKDLKLRAVAFIAAPFVLNTIILCNSRGSVLAMVVAAASSVFIVRSGYRLRLITAGLIFGAVFFALTDQTFIERQQSTQNYENDGSAQQRLTTWKGAYRLVKDRPFGAGGRGFHLLSPIYIPEIVAAHDGDLRAPHNTYVMVISEWGIAGMICFLGLYGSALLLLRRIKKLSAAHGGGEFYYWRAFALQIAFIGFLVASFFTDRLYAEAGYWMIALTFALYRMQLTQLAEAGAVMPASEPAASQARFSWQAATASRA